MRTWGWGSYENRGMSYQWVEVFLHACHVCNFTAGHVKKSHPLQDLLSVPSDATNAMEYVNVNSARARVFKRQDMFVDRVGRQRKEHELHHSSSAGAHPSAMGRFFPRNDCGT